MTRCYCCALRALCTPARFIKQISCASPTPRANTRSHIQNNALCRVWVYIYMYTTQAARKLISRRGEKARAPSGAHIYVCVYTYIYTRTHARARKSCNKEAEDVGCTGSQIRLSYCRPIRRGIPGERACRLRGRLILSLALSQLTCFAMSDERPDTVLPGRAAAGIEEEGQRIV